MNDSCQRLNTQYCIIALYGQGLSVAAFRKHTPNLDLGYFDLTDHSSYLYVNMCAS